MKNDIYHGLMLMNFMVLGVTGAAVLPLKIMMIVDRTDGSFLFTPVRGCRPGKIVQMTEAEVRGLCIKSREIFLSQPILLELEAPLKICGQCCTFLCLISCAWSPHHVYFCFLIGKTLAFPLKHV